jgi:hypothetical protein
MVVIEYLVEGEKREFLSKSDTAHEAVCHLIDAVGGASYESRKDRGGVIHFAKCKGKASPRPISFQVKEG